MIETRTEAELSSLDPAVRRDALNNLPEPGAPAVDGNVNMHLHSFYSYNALGYSPYRLAWEARKAGLYAAGLCDFDVLDGLEEFLLAGRTLSLRSTVNLETRAYLKEYADVDINSPGEPGVTYIMGGGFVRVPDADTEAGRTLQALADNARARNVALIERINQHVPDIALDYEGDVLPLTPTGNATERHIVSAYVAKAAAAFTDSTMLIQYWADLLERDLVETEALISDAPSLEEAVRARLAKRGGLGYAQPSESTFPPVEDFVNWVRSCDAMPMVTWLDGTSGGEADAMAMLECMKAKGAVSLNIIPDRNWNVKDADARAVKIKNLREMVGAAESLKMPINIGTEMNKLGLPFVDDLAGKELSAHRETFLRGARIMVGQTVLARYANFSYTGAAENAFDDTDKKNAFFEAVGALPPVDQRRDAELTEMGPERALTELQDAVGRG